VFVAGDQQAIPLLLRIRQFDPHNLPQSRTLIEKATASGNLAQVMPTGWIERHMKAGHVLVMIDGLDETEPELRDKKIIPWLTKIIQDYPECYYLISSRPVGYPPGSLRKLKFVECDLLDFGDQEITEYTRHWCTAIRLKDNEPEEEARSEGSREGDEIISGFKDHPYIRNLVRNPLMLSAICLVNYFEGGELPKDRVRLYKLCVEGLLHNWDKRRGIRTDFSLGEKLRVCREVAIAMQSDNLAEYPAEQVFEIFAATLQDKKRAAKLLENIRYRTGLLIERRSKVFAFAHLTFQEYLAAQSIVEGNQRKITATQLANEYADGRWGEVIALYCGISSVTASREMIKMLIIEKGIKGLSRVLTESFLSSPEEISSDKQLKQQVIKKISMLQPYIGTSQLARFPDEDVAFIANQTFIDMDYDQVIEAYIWLYNHSDSVNSDYLFEELSNWKNLNPKKVSLLLIIAHKNFPDPLLAKIAEDRELYEVKSGSYEIQANNAWGGLANRSQPFLNSLGTDAALLQILRAQVKSGLHIQFGGLMTIFWNSVFVNRNIPEDSSTWLEFVDLTKKLRKSLKKLKISREFQDFFQWADKIEAAIAKKDKQKAKAASTKKTKSVKAKSIKKQATKKAASKKLVRKKSASKKSSKITEGETKA
jgi:hypothetical protein